MMMDDALIKKIAREVAKETVKAMKKKGRSKRLHKDVITLLDSMSDLRDKIDQDKEDIEDMKREKFDENAWHDIKKLEGPQLDDQTRHMQKIRNRERSKLRTEQLLNRISKALEKIEDEDGYKIIEMKYLQGMSNEQIAEKLNYGATTVWRKHNRLIEKLERKLFGADALDYEEDVYETERIDT
jgi:RNA polymerase sigma factor (sigma-70 family)